MVDVEVFRVEHPGRSTPRTVTRRQRRSSTVTVFAPPSRGHAALTSTGEVVWKTRLPYQSQHGSGGSPAYRDLLIINCDGNGGPDDGSRGARCAHREDEVEDARRSPRTRRTRRRFVIRVGDRASRSAWSSSLRRMNRSPREIWRVGYTRAFERAAAGLRAWPCPSPRAFSNHADRRAP